ncbi:procollagen-lysine 5-dioxygenase [Aureococcus anophagefferens]|nr:procollagen-lysine 5-dioxygenase [Aureococcus anophagefferens]
MAALLLPADHELSRELAAQVAAPLPPQISSATRIAPGLVELRVRAGAATGYGCRAWRVVVGGEGVGDDVVDERFGGEPRSPARVRSADPSLALRGVDDCGVPDARFWEGLGARPSLRAIACRCVAWLEAPGGGDRDAWAAAEAKTARKRAAVVEFRDSMNAGGLVVNDCGMERLGDDLLARVVGPLASTLFGDEVFARSLDHHHLFAVRYAVGGASARHAPRGVEVTLNVCLGTAGFEGGALQFCGRVGDGDHRAASGAFDHRVGTAVLHLGRHRHGVARLASGERANLVLWARSSAFRSAAAFGHVALDGQTGRRDARGPRLPQRAQRPRLRQVALGSNRVT